MLKQQSSYPNTGSQDSAEPKHGQSVLSDNMEASIQNDDDWCGWRDEWAIRPDTIYLNHGSFGPPSREVRECQLSWQQRMASQTMEFFVRDYEPAWLSA